MITCKEDVQVVCTINGDEDMYYIRIDLKNGDKFLNTLEFADITDEVEDLIFVNKEINIYDNDEDMILDLAKNYLRQTIKSELDNDLRIGLLVNVKSKMLHRDGECAEDCPFCNETQGDDPFPDFTIALKTAEPEGNV